MLEIEMMDQLRGFLLDSGFEPYEQIRFLNGKIDFVGVKDNRCVVIESKVNKWKDALRQIMRYGHGADMSYIALPMTTAQYVYKKHQDIFNTHRIGLISVNLDKKRKAEILLTSSEKYCSQIYKQYLLSSIEGRRLRSNNRIMNLMDKFKLISGGGQKCLKYGID